MNKHCESTVLFPDISFFLVRCHSNRLYFTVRVTFKPQISVFVCFSMPVIQVFSSSSCVCVLFLFLSAVYIHHSALKPVAGFNVVVDRCI